MVTFPHGWERLKQLDFDDAFVSLFGKIEREFTKLEVRQAYSEPGDPSYEEFLLGRTNVANEELKKRIFSQLDLYTKLSQAGSSITRIRVVEFPVSNYINYELNSYVYSSLFGEKILVVDHTDIEIRHRENLYFRDFNCFDDFAALVHVYDESGKQDGGYLVTSALEVKKLKNLFAEIMKVSYPLGKFIFDCESALSRSIKIS